MRVEKMKEWYGDNKGYARERDVIETLAKWYAKGNLILKRGSGRTVEEIFGLPYTSTSDYAAVWNCQAEAVWKENPNYYFEGCALDIYQHVVAVFSERDTDGNEIDWHDIIIS